MREDLQRHAGDRFVARQVDLNERSARPQSLREEQVPLVCSRPWNVRQLELLRRRHHGIKRLLELLDQNLSVTAIGGLLANDVLVELLRGHRQPSLTPPDVLVQPAQNCNLTGLLDLSSQCRSPSRGSTPAQGVSSRPCRRA